MSAGNIWRALAPAPETILTANPPVVFADATHYTDHSTLQWDTDLENRATAGASDVANDPNAEWFTGVEPLMSTAEFGQRMPIFIPKLYRPGSETFPNWDMDYWT
jgi:hypothetical protein